MPARTSTNNEVVSTPTIPVRPVRSRRTPPKTGTLAPHTPLRPAAAVTGTRAALQSRSTACTCSVSAGFTTTDACTATCASSAQIMARGHQSRLAAATLGRGFDHLGARRPELRAQGIVDLDARRVQMIADVAGAERDRRSRCSPVGLHAGRLRNHEGGCDSASSAVSGNPPARRSSAIRAR